MNKIIISKFNSELSVKPCGQVSLTDWLFQENETLRDVVTQVRSTDVESDCLDLYYYQLGLPLISPNGICSYIGGNCVPVSPSVSICLDINQKDNPGFKDLEELKKEVSENPNVMYCGCSFDGQGLHCYIQIANPELHTRHFYALQKDFLNRGIVIDPKGKDECRRIRWSYDENYYVNPDAVPYEEFFEGPCEIGFGELFKYLKKEWLLAYIDNLDREDSVIQRVRDLLDRVRYAHIDLNDIYDLVMLCSIVKILLGEKIGRTLFRDISRMNSGYDYKQTEAVFDVCPSKEDGSDLSNDFIYDLQFMLADL